MAKKIFTALGLMSGTSMDGVDVAMLTTDGDAMLEMAGTFSLPYTPEQRRQLEAGLTDAKAITNREERPGALADLETASTEWHADAVSKFLQTHNISRSEIDVIGYHGQTVLHRPDQALTVQLGLGEMLAERTGIDVVYDMRADDMLKGGQGAPLVPVFHRALSVAHHITLPAVFVNIGGISNVTYIGTDGGFIAFDSGPGNALIDQWLQSEGGLPFDQGGRIASEGRIVQTIADRYLASPYFEAALPKSLDRLDFPPLTSGEAELSDGARTLAHVSAEAIVMAADHFPEIPKSWIISGGGRLNDTMMNDLRNLVAERNLGSVMMAEELEMDGDMLEAQAFAYLAVRSLLGLPLTFPGTTGCREETTGGILAKANAVG